MSVFRQGRLALLTVLFLVVIPSPSSAYRTFADEELCVDAGCTEARVVHANFPVIFELNSAGSDDVPFSNLQTEVVDAFQSWAEPACTGLVIDYQGASGVGATYGDGHSVVTWIESGWRDLGYGSTTLGITTQQLTNDGSGWVIETADMELNGDKTWTLAPTEGLIFGVRDVVIHEAGHFFGVMHPCEPFVSPYAPTCSDIIDSVDPFPVMWPSNMLAPSDLTPDDRDAICFLYPEADCGGTCPPGTACNTATMECLPIGVADAGSAGADASATPPVDGGGAAAIDAGSDPSPGARSDDGCGCVATGEGRRAGRYALLPFSAFLLFVLRRRYSPTGLPTSKGSLSNWWSLPHVRTTKR